MNVLERVYIPMTRKYVLSCVNVVFLQNNYWILCPLNPMTIFIVMPKNRPNHFLVWLLSRQQEFIDLSRRDSNWRDYSPCLCDSNWRDSKSQNFCAQLSQLQNYSRAQHFWKCCCLQDFHFHLYLCHATTCFRQKKLTPLWWGCIFWSSPAR